MSNFTLDIMFVAGGSVSFTGETAKQRDLGGAEYCVVSMASGLAKRGHSVSVFVPNSDTVFAGQSHVVADNVTYFPLELAWKNVNHGTMWDVAILSRDYSFLSNTVLNAKQLVLWDHDILTDPDGFRTHIGRADKIYCL